MQMPRPVYIVWRVIEMVAQLGSRTINAVVFGGSTRQTVSARAYIEKWPRGKRWINAVFSPWQEDHCASAWLDEVTDALKTLERNAALGQMED